MSEVNLLVDRFFEARKMMLSMAKSGGMPGMPGAPGTGKRAKAKQASAQARKGKVKRASGNPAKRAEQERAAAVRATTPAGLGADPFGLGAADPTANGHDDLDPRDFQLPPEVAKFLK